MNTLHEKNGELYIGISKVIRGWESFSGWYWFAISIDHKQTSVIEGKEYPNDIIYYGFVQGDFEEWGCFSLAELESSHPLVWEIPKENLHFSGRR